MNVFLFNFILALAWTALTGKLDLAHLATGFALGAGALLVTRGIWGGGTYFRRLVRLCALIAWALVELTVAAGVEAVHALSWRRRPTTRIRLPISLKTEGEIALFASLASLSPNTLVVGLGEDQSSLIIETSPRMATALEVRATRLLEQQIRAVSK